MEKNISVTDGGNVLLTAFVSHNKNTTSIASTTPQNISVKHRGNTISKLIQKFIKWQKEFFTLEGFDSYNDVYF